MRCVGMLVAAGLCVAGAGAKAATPPNLVGTWSPTNDSVGAMIGKGFNGWPDASAANLRLGARPTLVIEKQDGRAVAGYMTLADGAHAPFVGIIKRNGKQLIGSNSTGAITADLSGNEMEECWADTLADVTAAACNVLRRAKK